MKPPIKPRDIAVENILGALLLAYPALLFLVRGGMNGSMFVLAILSVMLLLAGCRKHLPLLAGEIAFALAMSSGLAAILIVQIHHHDLSAKYFDSAARFLLAVPILLALRHARTGKAWRALQYAFPLGAIAALLAVLVENRWHAYAQTSFLNHIHLGDMAILLAFLSLFGINWMDRDSLPLKLLKISGFFAGLIVSVLSQARGSWIAIPIFIAIYVYAHLQTKYVMRAALLSALALLVIGLGCWLIEPIQLRIGLIFSDLSQFRAGHADTSIGIRLQLWGTALHLIGENPFFGVGAGGFAEAMRPMSELGRITPLAADLGRAEVHSEILAQTVRFGIFGLGFVLALYFVPFYLFACLARSADHQQAVAAMMGMCVTLGFFVFGLTVETFNLKMTAAFYSTTIAVLLAMATATGNHPKDRASGAGCGFGKWE